MVTTVIKTDASELTKSYYDNVLKKLKLSPFVSGVDYFRLDKDGYYYNYLTYKPTFSFIKATYIGLVLALIIYIFGTMGFWFYAALALCGLDYFSTESFTFWVTKKSLAKNKYNGTLQLIDSTEGLTLLWDKLR